MDMDPMFACFAGRGSADLTMLLSAVATFWVIAGVATLANIFVLALFAARRRPFMFHAVLVAGYLTIAALMFTGTLFNIAPTVGAAAIIVLPIVTITHCIFVLNRFRRLRSG
jgi:hypothetical protein